MHYDGKIINFTTLGFLIFKKLQNVELFMDDTPIKDTRQRTTDGENCNRSRKNYASIYSTCCFPEEGSHFVNDLDLVTFLFSGCSVVEASSQCFSACNTFSCRKECIPSGHAYGRCRRKYNCPSNKTNVCRWVLKSSKMSTKKKK